MLDTFNDIRVERISDDGLRQTDYVVPINFGSRDKAFVLSEQDSEAMLRGNVNILPRMALAFEGITPAKERQTNKYTKINKVIDGETISFQYNAVAMDFSFTLHIATRNMLDMSMIQEQIIPFFNPSYSLFVNELEIQEEPTSIPVIMESADITLPEEYEAEEIRIIEGSISFIVKGNLYPPIKDAEKIAKVKIYMGLNVDNVEHRTSRFDYQVDGLLNNTASLKSEFFETIGQNNPVITNIEGNLSILDGGETTIKVLVEDVDSDIFTYVWSITNNIGSIQTNKSEVIYSTPGNLSSNDIADIRVIVIDEKGLQSQPFDFSINIGA